MTRGVRPRALSLLLDFREREAQKRAYGLQLLWLATRQLQALLGGDETGLPDYFGLFPERGAGDAPSAEDIRGQVLRRLRAGQAPPRSREA